MSDLDRAAEAERALRVERRLHAQALEQRDHARALAITYEQMLNMTPEERDLFTKPHMVILDAQDAQWRAATKKETDA